MIHPAQGGRGHQVLHHSGLAKEREMLSSSRGGIGRSDDNSRRRKVYRKITVSNTAEVLVSHAWKLYNELHNDFQHTEP